ncbi:hypothetical protein BDZ89DRAFT_1130728 [Hymenopellis radicata]|nr:hypothetical protein BDZ89DRAFT_1130728 [Hymenopellis radicata]
MSLIGGFTISSGLSKTNMDGILITRVLLPVSAISIIPIWGLLLASYCPPPSPDGEGDIEIRTVRPTREPFTAKHWVTFICLFTIALWCVAHEIEDIIGDIALIPIVAFFSTGVLKKVGLYFFAARLKHSLQNMIRLPPVCFKKPI